MCNVQSFELYLAGGSGKNISTLSSWKREFSVRGVQVSRDPCRDPFSPLEHRKATRCLLLGQRAHGLSGQVSNQYLMRPHR